MPLEAVYKNPEVILTTSATPKQQNYSKYTKCLGVILIAYFLVTFTFTESLLLSMSVVTLLIALVLMILNRPRVVMNNVKKYLWVTGNRDSTQNFRIPPTMVERVQVKSKNFRSQKSKASENVPGAAENPEGFKNPNIWYYTQIHVKEQKGRKKKKHIIIDSFDIQDIVEAHYMAQLIAAFAGCKVFDVKGKRLPELNSNIPTKYLKE